MTAGPKLYRVARSLGITGEQMLKVPPALEGLAAATGETAHLAELRGKHVIYLVNRYPRNALRVQTESGSVEAAHSTAVGKALMIGLSAGEVRSIFRGVDLERYTDNTITDVEVLIDALEAARGTGFATDSEEQTKGTGCIAAPVRDARGMVVAAVGISGPRARVASNETAMARSVVSCAREVEEVLKPEPLETRRERRTVSEGGT